MRDSIVASAVLLQNGGASLVNESLRETFRALNSSQAKEVEMALLKRLSMMKETVLWSPPKSIFRSIPQRIALSGIVVYGRYICPMT